MNETPGAKKNLAESHLEWIKRWLYNITLQRFAMKRGVRTFACIFCKEHNETFYSNWSREKKTRQAKSVFQVEMQYNENTQSAVTTRMTAFAEDKISQYLHHNSYSYWTETNSSRSRIQPPTYWLRTRSLIMVPFKPHLSRVDITINFTTYTFGAIKYPKVPLLKISKWNP